MEPSDRPDEDASVRGVTSARKDLRDDTFAQGVLNAEIFARMFGEPNDALLETLGRYEILRELGVGGMGVVYLAHDPELDRNIALKVLRAELRHDDTQGRQRIRSEARAMARLTHPHVVQIHDVGRRGEHLFIAMEYVEGTTLGRWLHDEPRSWHEILQAFIDAGRGLAAAHGASLVHRDFKPDNVLVSLTGEIKVTDFGIATALEPRSGEEPRPKVAGTLRYMSPEQLAGRTVDARSDQFSFCVAAYEALLGEHPFDTTSVGSLTVSIMDGERRPRPEHRTVPRWVLEAVTRGLSRDADDRWPSMVELLDVLRNDPAVQRRRWLTGGAIALTAGLAAFVAGQEVTDPPPDPCAEGSLVAQQTWGPDLQRAVERHFTSLQLPYAAASEQVARQALDAWRTDWTDAYEALCQSRHEDDEAHYRVRMGCLQQQRQQVGAFVRLLGEANAGLVAKLPVVLDDLPRTSRCARPEALDGVEPPAVEIADEVADLRERLARLDARMMAFDFEVDEPLDALNTRANELDYRPLMAEIAMARAKHFSWTQDDPPTTQLLRAHALALEAGHEAVALDAANSMLLTHNEHPSLEVTRYAREQWNSIAEGLSARLGRPIEAELQRRSHYIRALRKDEHFDAMAQQVAAAMELVRSTVGLGDHRAASILEQHAMVQFQDQQVDAALETLRQVDALYDGWVGPDHPHRLPVLNYRVGMLLSMGRLNEATAAASQMLDITLRAYGPGAKEARMAYGKMAMLQDMRGDHAEARRMYEGLFEGVVPAGESMRPQDVELVNSYCFVLYKLGEYDEAAYACEQALAGSERVFPEGSPNRAVVLNNLALVARGRGQPEQGLAFDRRALAICEGFDPPQPQFTAYALVGLGEGLLMLERPDEAVPLLERAVALRDELPNPFEQGEARCLLARARGEPEARSLATTALAKLRRGGPDWARQAGDCAAWLDATPPSGEQRPGPP